MFEVQNPKTGKVYTYGPARYAAAVALANKFGVEVTRRDRVREREVRFSRPRGVCPHGDLYGECDRGACDEIYGPEYY